MRHMIQGYLLIIGLVMALAVQAAQASVDRVATPHQVIENTVDELVRIITEAKTYFEKNPERFYGEIERVVDPLIDFPAFARSVMGKYASKKRYDALETAEEKEKFLAQLDRFSATFKQGLVKTYGKGLLTFDGQEIEVRPPLASDAAKIEQGKSVIVTQLIHGSAEQPYVVKFKMRPDRQQQWKLRNVTIESINIGKVYRSQFEAAMKKHDGDVDKVIDNWIVRTKDITDKKSS